MKQIGQISNNSIATKEDNKMLSDYWKVIIKDGVESLALSDNEFLKKYSDEKTFSNLRTIETFAVYEVQECSVCLKPFNVVINDRNHLKLYSQTKNKCCRLCEHYQSSIEKSIKTNINN